VSSGAETLFTPSTCAEQAKTSGSTSQVPLYHPSPWSFASLLLLKGGLLEEISELLVEQGEIYHGQNTMHAKKKTSTKGPEK